MLTDKEIHERITRGIEYLDTNHPGWEHKINLDKLNMGDWNCVCWQLNINRLPKVNKDNDPVSTLDMDKGFVFFLPCEGIRLTKLWKQRIQEKLNLNKTISVVSYKDKVYKVFGESSYNGVDYFSLIDGDNLILVRQDDTKSVVLAKDMIPGKHYLVSSNRVLCINKVDLADYSVYTSAYLDVKDYTVHPIFNPEYCVIEVD